MADIPLQTEELLAKVAAAVELLMRGPLNSNDNSRKEEIKTALNEIEEIKAEDINIDLANNPSLRDQVLDLHQQIKSSGFYDTVANISLGFVLVLLFAGIVVGTQGNIVTASETTLLPTLGQFVYLAVLPVLAGIITSWKSQSILDNNLYPKLALLLKDPNNALTIAVAKRQEFLQQRNVVLESNDAVVATSFVSTDKKQESFTPAADGVKPEGTKPTTTEAVEKPPSNQDTQQNPDKNRL